MRIGFSVTGEQEVEAHLLGMSERMDHPEPALEAIADDIRHIESLLFDSEDSWAPLAESTIAQKAARGYSPKILQATEAMRKSLTDHGNPGGFSLVVGDELHFGTSVEYAKFHSTGTSRMPARDPLPVNVVDQKRWTKIIQSYMVAEERAAFGMAPFGLGI